MRSDSDVGIISTQSTLIGASFGSPRSLRKTAISVWAQVVAPMGCGVAIFERANQKFLAGRIGEPAAQRGTTSSRRSSSRMFRQSWPSACRT